MADSNTQSSNKPGRTPSPEEIKQAIESGALTVADLGPETKAVYDQMMASGATPDITAQSLIADPYQAVANVTASPMQSIKEFFGGNSQYQTSAGETIPDPYSGTSLPELALGVGETVFSFATGVPAVAAATVMGGYEVLKGAYQNKTWYQNLKAATDSVNGIMGSVVYTPQTSAGKDISAVINAPFMLLDEGSTAAQNFITSASGGSTTSTGADPMLLTQFQLAADEIQGYRERNEAVPDELFEKANSLRNLIGERGGLGETVVNKPALFAGVSTKALIDFLPDIAGRGRAAAIRSQKISELRRTATELGIDLSDLPENQIAQLAESADLFTGGQRVVAERLGTFAERLQRQQEITKRMASQLFDEAKATEGYYPQAQLKLLDQSMADLLATEQFALANLKVAQGRLKTFNNIVSNTAFDLLDKNNNIVNGYIPLNQLHNFRQLLNADIKKMKKMDTYEGKSEYQALLAMKSHIDEFIDTQFEADLISGNTEAISKWKKANNWYRDYKNNFQASKIISTIVDQELTPEQVKNLILGSGEVVGKAEAGLVVKRLNNIFGNESSQMESLRQEVLFGIVTPLLDDVPNITEFSNRVNKLKRNNPTLVSQLFQGEALTNLNNLTKLAKAQLEVAARTGDTTLVNRPSLERLIAINIAPGATQLAKSQANIGIFTAVLGKLKTALKAVSGRPDVERQVMSEFYQTDMSKPFMGLQNFPRIGAIQATRRAEEEATDNEGRERLDAMRQNIRAYGEEIRQRN
tara:strand:+ start:911 stop:3178 length:2268 start_codon:yes stop_codon:yes gene_type:complete